MFASVISLLKQDVLRVISIYIWRNERSVFIIMIKHTTSYRMGRSTIFQFTLESPIRHRVASKQSGHGAERGHRQTMAFVRKSRRGARGVGGKHAVSGEPLISCSNSRRPLWQAARQDLSSRLSPREPDLPLQRSNATYKELSYCR